MLTDFVNLLLVEDSDADASKVKHVIEDQAHLIITSKGIHISRVFSIQEAREVLNNKKVDIVLLDMFLPDAQFLEGLEILVNEFPQTPIIVYTTVYDSEYASKAFKLGAQDYIIKQFTNPSELLRSILAALERHKVQQKVISRLTKMLEDC